MFLVLNPALWRFSRVEGFVLLPFSKSRYVHQL